jgi:hypothetical protein
MRHCASSELDREGIDIYADLCCYFDDGWCSWMRKTQLTVSAEEEDAPKSKNTDMEADSRSKREKILSI